MRIELAKTGTFGDITINQQDLLDCVANFNPNDRVPIHKGHDTAMWDDSQPADGWINSVYMDGDVLIGDIELFPELQAEYDEGKFKNWSIGMSYNEQVSGWYLHHLAFLGAVPPKIKGLQVLEMSDKKLGKCRSLTFSDAQIITEEKSNQAKNKEENEGGNADMTLTKEEAERLKAEKKAADDALEAEKAKSAKMKEANKELSDKVNQQKKEARKADIKLLSDAVMGKIPKDAADALEKAFSDALEGNVKLFSDVDDKGGKVDGVISAVIGAFAKMPKLASDKAHDFSDKKEGIKASIKFGKF